MSLQSDLGKVRGLGSAKEGTHHWWWQRVTAVAMIPLSLWFISGLLCMIEGDYQQALDWVSKPHVTVLTVAFLGALFYHLKLGMQVVIEDYVHQEWVKIAALIGLKFAAALGALAAIIAILKISL